MTALLLAGVVSITAGVTALIACWHKPHTPLWAVLAILAGTVACFVWAFVGGVGAGTVVAGGGLAGWLLVSVYEWRGRRARTRRGGDR